MDAIHKGRWQLLFSLGYVALFLFLFVVKTAPEQTLRATIHIEATPDQVATVLQTGRPIETLTPTTAPECSSSSTPWRLVHLATATDGWVAILLTKAEHTNVSVQQDTSHTLLTVETRWQVHGGLLGKAFDQVIGRRARVKAISATLRKLKAQAEAQVTKQA